MRNLKKILSLVLAMMMVLSLMVTASATTFADDEDIDANYKEAVEVLTGLKVINGVGDEFLPKDYLNREAAAKIVAYVKLGGDVDATIAEALNNPFSDVKGWSTNVIKYCYSEGIVDGVGDGKFLPKDYLTGYAFAKMLLVAAGIDGEYTGSNWKLNIATAAKNAKLLVGLENVALSGKLTREQACQMAFNAMNYSATGTTSVYVVKTSADVELYRGTDALTALVLKQADAGNVLTVEATNAGSLMDVVFQTKSSSATDAFGRTSKTWVSKNNATKVYAELAATPVKTYTTATTYGKIFSDLGYTKASENITLKVFDNSAVGSDNTVTKGDLTPVGGQGTLIEVYKTAANAYNVVVIDTYAIKLAATNIVAAVPATATTDAVPAFVWIDLNSDGNKDAGEKFVTSSFKKDDVVLYTEADGALVNVVKADSFSGKVTATAAAYFRVDGVAKVLAANNSAVIGTTPGYKYDAATTYTYFVDAYGNVIYAVAGEVDTPDVSYIYIISKGAKAASYVPGDLYGEGTGTAAAAQALVMDLETGVISVVNQGVVKGTDGKYYYATATGAASTTEVTDAAVALVEGLYEYTKRADGSIAIGSAATTANVTLKKGEAAVGDKFANASTAVTVLSYTKDAIGNYVSVEKTTYTGIANFPATAVTYNGALVAANPINGVISTITVVKAADPVVTAPDYAVYAGLGEISANGQAYAFILNGELVNYYLAQGVTDAQAGISTLTAGDVITLKLTNGALAASAVAKQTALKSGEVTYVDDNFMVIDGSVYYFAEGAQIYVASDYSYAKGTVEVGDTVNVYGDVVNGSNVVSFILK